jgi:hypothetical protein
MDLPSYFAKFLREIRLTDKQDQDCRTGQTTLRERLMNDENLKPLLVNTFLQGSYKRGTAVRPAGDERSDVDVIVVTRIKRSDHPNPDTAMNLFIPFLERHYKGKWQKQGRSLGIELSYVDLDLVVTSAPSEEEEKVYLSKAVASAVSLEEAPDWRLVEAWSPPTERPGGVMLKEALLAGEWQTEPLWIPDRERRRWRRTHPLEQIKWTQGKNARCNGHYVNVVKAVKWWQRVNHEDDRPRSYPLEHLVGECCSDGTSSVAAGVVSALEGMVRNYPMGRKPVLPDRGVPEHDVLARVTAEEFAEFYDHAQRATRLARAAFDAKDLKASVDNWRKLFGDKFPPAGDEGGAESDPKGPFLALGAKSQTGDLTPRKYGMDG